MQVDAKVKTVLVVEDDRGFRKTLKVILEQGGFKVIEAINGREGIQAFALVYPDFVITDINLPHITGDRLLSEIKAFNPASIIIAVSGDSAKLQTARQLGADAVFCKPFDPDLLLETLGRYSNSKPVSEAEARQCA